ncbi:MAG: carbon-nitrogen hydrolase [Deltaproteobacteria bacterium SG8_13]|nr:MAG: carbon-nitrogen hydrolase [Deltaproteobacteria bacterium SG8_13]
MTRNQPTDSLTVGLAQIAPIWLNRSKTLEKILAQVHTAVEKGCHLVVFGEALLPGYPFWIERTDGARFNSPMQKEIHAHYMQQAVQIEAGHLDALCRAAAKVQIAVVLGIIERPADRGGHSLYASLVYISPEGVVQSVHRKLMPTYEERLTWSPGDGHGLRVHRLGPFTVGGLNCWENWMPLARAALYAQGEDLHVAIWPGGLHNTQDSTRFIAIEARSYVVSVSGFMQASDFPADTPHLAAITADIDGPLANGGSCIAGPDGCWVVEPVVGEERLIVAVLEHRRVREERQNFDPVGHYSRPDVTQLTVNRQRQQTVQIVD